MHTPVYLTSTGAALQPEAKWEDDEKCLLCGTVWGAWQEKGLGHARYKWMQCTSCQKYICARCHNKGFTPIHEKFCMSTNHPEKARKSAQKQAAKKAKKQADSEATPTEGEAVLDFTAVVPPEPAESLQRMCASAKEAAEPPRKKQKTANAPPSAPPLQGLARSAGDERRQQTRPMPDRTPVKPRKPVPHVQDGLYIRIADSPQVRLNAARKAEEARVAKKKAAEKK